MTVAMPKDVRVVGDHPGRSVIAESVLRYATELVELEPDYINTSHSLGHLGLERLQVVEIAFQVATEFALSDIRDVALDGVHTLDDLIDIIVAETVYTSETPFNRFARSLSGVEPMRILIIADAAWRRWLRNLFGVR